MRFCRFVEWFKQLRDDDQSVVIGFFLFVIISLLFGADYVFRIPEASKLNATVYESNESAKSVFVDDHVENVCVSDEAVVICESKLILLPSKLGALKPGDKLTVVRDVGRVIGVRYFNRLEWRKESRDRSEKE